MRKGGCWAVERDRVVRMGGIKGWVGDRLSVEWKRRGNKECVKRR